MVRRATLKGEFGNSETSAMEARNQSNPNRQDRTRPNHFHDKILKLLELILVNYSYSIN